MNNTNKLRGKIAEVYRTQKEFAKAVGVTPAYVSLMLDGKVKWAEDKVQKALVLLGIEESDRQIYFPN